MSDRLFFPLALLGVAMVLVGALDLARFSAELEGAVDEAS